MDFIRSVIKFGNSKRNVEYNNDQQAITLVDDDDDNSNNDQQIINLVDDENDNSPDPGYSKIPPVMRGEIPPVLRGIGMNPHPIDHKLIFDPYGELGGGHHMFYYKENIDSEPIKFIKSVSKHLERAFKFDADGKAKLISNSDWIRKKSKYFNHRENRVMTPTEIIHMWNKTRDIGTVMHDIEERYLKFGIPYDGREIVIETKTKGVVERFIEDGNKKEFSPPEIVERYTYNLFFFYV